MQASWPGAAGCGQNALAPRLAAHLPAWTSLARIAITLRRGAAIALKGLGTALRRRLRLVFAVVVSDAADRRQLVLVSEDKVEAHPSRRASISWPV